MYTSSPLTGGNDTEVDEDIDGPLVRTGVPARRPPTVTTASNPNWPSETDVVIVPGTKIKLSAQSPLLRGIFKLGFENIRKALLFNVAFPSVEKLPCVLRGSVVEAARDYTTLGGHYNPLARCVHQRILTDVSYESKLIRLVSSRITYIT